MIAWISSVRKFIAAESVVPDPKPTLRLLVRADASSRLGSGHVLRSLALTEELRCRGGEAIFVCRDAPGHLADWIRDRGYPVRLIEALDCPEADAQATRQAAAADGPFDWLWVDHYHLDARWERAARGLARRTAAIDDMADRPHDVDLFVDYTHPASEAALYDPLLPAGTRRLIGHDYVFLRREFTDRPVPERDYSSVKRLLVMQGGSDPPGMTDRVLDALDAPEFADLRVDVAVGLSNLRLTALRRRLGDCPNRQLHVQHLRPSDLMRQADLCIGAGGMTSWERCYLGLPTLAIVIVENQMHITNMLAAYGALQNLGRSENLSIVALREHLRWAIADDIWRRRSGTLGQHLIDGHGVCRVIDALENPTL